MAMRTLRRKVIIREYDFIKVRDQALGTGLIDNDGALYDRVSWTPINKDTLEKLKLVEILRGKTGPITQIDLDLKTPAILVAQLRDYLYNEKYYRWKVSIDDEGYVCIQSRKNTPNTRLGWGVFEKDLYSRL
jgi:hypothetical protein